MAQVLFCFYINDLRVRLAVRKFDISEQISVLKKGQHSPRAASAAAAATAVISDDISHVHEDT